MAETDGTTCPTCMTLNSPAAPACARCNMPLSAAGPVPSGGTLPGAAPTPGGTLPAASPTPGGTPPARARTTAAAPAPDPATGARQIGPGLAGFAGAAPNSSRAAAAPVQPPGYGMDAPPPPPPPPGPTPADLRRARRRVVVAGLVLVALVLAVGGSAVWLTRPRYVDTSAVGRAVGAELTARLGDRVTVECRGSPRRRAGETFRCTARDARGARQPVTVVLLDDTGRYVWRLGP